MILCLGDSITLGMIGYSYVDFLDPAIDSVNKGVNGDTTACAYERLSRYLYMPNMKEIDSCVVFIGTNDILLPYLASLPGMWKLRYIPRLRLKRCILDDNDFELEYERYLNLLEKHNKKTILVGIPFSETRGYPNDIVKKRNEIIKQLAEKYRAEFIDISEIQQSIANGIKRSYSWKGKLLIRGTDVITMLLLPFTKDWFSRKRHLKTTVDGIHFNSASAKALAKAVEDALNA